MSAPEESSFKIYFGSFNNIVPINIVDLEFNFERFLRINDILKGKNFGFHCSVRCAKASS